VEVRTSPFYILGFCFVAQVGLEVYKSTNAIRSAPARPRPLGRSLGSSCIVCAVREEGNSQREDIRHHELQVDSDEIPRCIEAARAGMHAVAADRDAGTPASGGAKCETPTKPSLTNGTNRSARSATAAVASNMSGVGDENEEDASTAVGSSPVDMKRSGWGRDDAGGSVGGHVASPVEVRPPERSSRPTSSAWGKILVVPSPTISHSPTSLSAWDTAHRPESHDPPPAGLNGRASSALFPARRTIPVLNTGGPVEDSPYKNGGVGPPNGFGFVHRAEF